MNRLVLSIAGILALVTFPALAQYGGNPFETINQARERQSAERYDYQQRNGTPLGGYPERLGNPAPQGTNSPGFTTPYGSSGNPSGYGGNSLGGGSYGNPYGSNNGRR